MLNTFQHQNLRLNYYDSGGKGPVFIFQHGLTGDHNQTSQSFIDKQYRLITLDCRGHGQSQIGPDADLNISTFAQDLSALMDYLTLKKASIGGISMGAALCAHFSARYPEKVSHLILVRPSWVSDASPVNMMIYSVAADYLALYGPDEGLKRFIRSAAYKTLEKGSPDNANSLKSLFSGQDPAATVTLLRRIFTCDPAFDGTAIQRSKIPCCCVGTPWDVIHPLSVARQLAAEIGIGDIHEIYAKSLDKSRHITELTSIITSFIKNSPPL